MRYAVIVSPTAMKEAEEYATLIRTRRHDDVASNAWWDGLIDALLSLELMPGRCPLIHEAVRSRTKFHHLLYASHRIVFMIESKNVQVARIYHVSRRPLKRSDLRRRARPA